MNSETLRSFDDTPIHFTVEGQGPLDILLCDGIGCDGYIWRYLRPHLRPRGRVIHPHIRGHGKSGVPTDLTVVGIPDIATDFRAVLDHLGSERVVVMGHSMGVQVALEIWNQDRDRVAGIVLMCGSYGHPASTFRDGRSMRYLLPFLRAGARAGGETLRRIWRVATPTRMSALVAQLTELHPDFLRPHDLELYLAHLAEMDPQVFFEMLAGAEAHTASPYLTQIDVPTLIIAGEHDRFTPAWLSAEMARRVPTAEFLCVRDGTHASPVEQPTEINLRVERFLDGHFAPATGTTQSS
jgi:pimeloyl-ACP methyl ester carboxylesterase